MIDLFAIGEDAAAGIANAIAAGAPSVGSLWTDLWPAVVIFVAAAVFQGYVTVRNGMQRNVWSARNPVIRLVWGMQNAGERFFVWVRPPWDLKSLTVPVRMVGIFAGRLLQLGAFGKAGDRVKKRASAILRGRSAGVKIGIAIVSTTLWALAVFGVKFTSALALLSNFDPTAWGALAAIFVGGLGYVEPLLSGIPGADTLTQPEMAVVAFALTFGLVWFVDGFLWWRAVNQRPILRWFNRVFR